MKLFFCLLLCSVYLVTYSQDAKRLVADGISLHDNGQLEDAVKKFDSAIILDNNYYSAYYEKSYSLLALKKYKESNELSKYILTNFKSDRNNAAVYINYGTGLDLLGKQKEAIEIYNEGIKNFPSMALLHYNKAITLYGMKQNEEALNAIKASISLNPYHASSHNFLSVTTAKEKKVQSIMSSLVLIAIEPTSERAKEHVNMVETALSSAAKKTGDNSVTISLDLPSSDKKGGEDDFRPIEMFIGLNAALDFDDKHKNETRVERMHRKLEGLFAMLGEGRGKKSKDFAWTHYAPFFTKLKSEQYLEVFSHLLYSSSNDDANKKWLQANTEKVESFNSWFKGFWKKE